MIINKLNGPIWLMQPIPYFGEKLEGDWIIEPKIDGWRMQIIKCADERTECWGRRLDKKPDWSEKLDCLTKATKNLPNGTLLDCELFSSGGRRFIPSLLTKKSKIKPIIYVFDIIYYNNVFVGNLSLKQRKTILTRLTLKSPLQPVKYMKYNGKLEFKVKQEHEGIVLKNLDSKYNIGKDAPLATMDWRKIKWR
jgi:ATP-dependent DNA ligase